MLSFLMPKVTSNLTQLLVSGSNTQGCFVLLKEVFSSCSCKYGYAIVNVPQAKFDKVSE